MKRRIYFTIAGAAFGAAVASAWAQPISEGKNQYHLFNPTPREFMREMATDRPDTTESPTTIDAGHLQVEMSFVEYVRDGSSEAIGVMPTNFRLGVLNDVEFALVVQPLVRMQDAFSNNSGFGDLEARAKLNVWGNDIGQTAFAVLPYILIPTADAAIGHGHVEGGIAFPFSADLENGWGIGLMGQFDAVYDPARDAYDIEFLHTAAFGFDVVGRLGAYLEYIGIASSAPDAEYLVLLGGGLTYALSSDWQLDLGINVGVAGSAPDINPFVGMSVRF